MSTQFFERQEIQRSQTRWLVWAFIMAILLVVLVINVVLLLGLGAHPLEVLRDEPAIIIWTSVVVAGTILVASWYKSSKFSAGGAAVARALGGVPVVAAENDLKRKRLLNIVDEMAIAARIRRPQVYVLPDEPGINAFAAGYSPDQAAVAVTQGALDTLDRDQLQAVIGHEFSHILNGDMKINMRLTAWIFGLFVITDIARRILRGRGRGKGAARIKLIALGVFIAGSAGMLAGRLLQAAVSRRREHLADASAVQFTRNPQALQGAFIIMAAHSQGTSLQHESSADLAHMFIADSNAASWANKLGGSWLATHPPIEERVRALDSRVTPTRFKTLVSDERRKIKAAEEAALAAAEAAASPAVVAAPKPATPESLALDVDVSGLPAALAPVGAAAVAAAAAAPATPATPPTPAASASPAVSPSAFVPPKPVPDADSSGRMAGLSLVRTAEVRALSETLPPGIRKVGGQQLPPDVLRDRLSEEQQSAITQHLSQIERDPVSVQAAYIATLLASEPARWRMQLTKLAPVLGIELFKETQAQIARLSTLAPAARLPLLTDLLGLLEALEPAQRKKLRGVVRAFAPTVTAGDMLRFTLTRLLDKRLGKPADAAPPVPLPERAQSVCELYASLSHCRFGAGTQGQNAYRAGLMGMLPPQKWLPFPELPLTFAALDAALQGVSQVHPTGKRMFSDGMARVIAVGGRLTVPQVDLLRGICLIVDCTVPLIPADVVYDDARPSARVQAGAR
jgi:Zn-dependent protease with chaperone function